MHDVPANSAAIAPEDIEVFQQHLFRWWSTNQRDLPWRHTRDPYRILVSEVMLQQTQVDRVIGYWERWLDRFPTVVALADAPTAEVIRLWAGLGYNRRAVNLQRTAQAVVERGGTFPDSVDALKELPGIGPYTAGAIACFAFGQDVPFIDTNMRRVLHRVFVGVDVPTPMWTDREITALAARCLPAGNGWDWNQALIEFGALQCTARKPACVICPAHKECIARPFIHGAIAAATGTVKPKQSRFEDTNRYFRGRIVDTLRKHEGDGIALGDLGPLIRSPFGADDMPWLLDIVHSLERDGLAKIAETEAEYDAGTVPADEVHISLP